MKIQYCNDTRLNMEKEIDFKITIENFIESNNKSNCSHNDIQISICINDPLKINHKGNVFCNDCKKEIIEFDKNIYTYKG